MHLFNSLPMKALGNITGIRHMDDRFLPYYVFCFCPPTYASLAAFNESGGISVIVPAHNSLSEELYVKRQAKRGLFKIVIQPQPIDHLFYMHKPVHELNFGLRDNQDIVGGILDAYKVRNMISTDMFMVKDFGNDAVVNHSGA